jgi:hypothetical protein
MLQEESPESNHPCDVPIECGYVRASALPKVTKERSSSLNEPVEGLLLRTTTIDSAHVLSLRQGRGGVVGGSIGFPAAKDVPIATIEHREETEQTLGFLFNVRDIACMVPLEGLGCQQRP